MRIDCFKALLIPWKYIVDKLAFLKSIDYNKHITIQILSYGWYQCNKTGFLLKYFVI